jgi:flagellar motility protein MotE (MotC chaperone)
MSKMQMFILIGAFVLGWVLSIGGAMIFMKPEIDQSFVDSLAMVDSLEQVARERGLDLTLDISIVQPDPTGGPFMMPGEGEAEDSTAVGIPDQLSPQDATLALMDSVTAARTEPLQAEVEQARELAEQAEARSGELENLLAMLSADADSIDQSNAKRLAKIIESMRPDDAAAVMNGLGSRTSARLLITMRQRSAAKILSSMPRERAAEVARYLSQAYEKSSI